MLSIRDQVTDASAVTFVRDALATLHAWMGEHHVRAMGPPFVIRRPVAPGVVDIEVGRPVGRLTEGSGVIHGELLPASLVRVYGTDPSDASDHFLTPDEGLDAFE